MATTKRRGGWLHKNLNRSSFVLFKVAAKTSLGPLLGLCLDRIRSKTISRYSVNGAKFSTFGNCIRWQTLFLFIARQETNEWLPFSIKHRFTETAGLFLRGEDTPTDWQPSSSIARFVGIFSRTETTRWYWAISTYFRAVIQSLHDPLFPFPNRTVRYHP